MGLEKNIKPDIFFTASQLHSSTASKKSSQQSKKDKISEGTRPHQEKLFQMTALQRAYEKICYRRRDCCCNNDIWDLRFNWDNLKEEMLAKLNSGEYRFDALQEILIDGQIYEIWSSADAVVIEAVTMLLKEKYAVTRECSSYHLKGNGGVKAAVYKAQAGIRQYKYFYKSDIKKYYASIDHDILLDMFRSRIPHREVISLLYQFLKRTGYRYGYYRTAKKGICRGSSLSPILGAIYLEELDIYMNKLKNVPYTRYMDDWVFMCSNRWKFARIIKNVCKIVEKLKLEVAYDKTLIGRTKNGFDFLGFRIEDDGLAPSDKSKRRLAGRIIEKFEKCGESISVEKLSILLNRAYSSGCQRINLKKGELSIPESISKYIQRWTQWIKSIYGHEKIEICETRVASHGS